VNIAKYDLALLFTQRHLNATRRNRTLALLCRRFCANSAPSTAVGYTCETIHHFPYTIMPTPDERKQLQESEFNSHGSKMVPTTNSILTQRQVGCW